MNPPTYNHPNPPPPVAGGVQIQLGSNSQQTTASGLLMYQAGTSQVDVIQNKRNQSPKMIYYSFLLQILQHLFLSVLIKHYILN